ncbi:C-signal-like [Discoglossus pictus]
MAALSLGSVLITGSNRGIGLGLVRRFLEMDDPPQHVFAACRDPSLAQDLQSLATEHPNLQIIQLEVTDPNSIKEAFKVVDKKVGGAGLNMIINNAGILTNLTVEDSNQEDMITVYKTNTIGPMMVTQEFIPLLKKAAQEHPQERMSCLKAAVVNITSSLGSLQDLPTLFSHFPKIAYRASKAALNMVTQCQALTYKSDGILCVTVHPGWVRTDMGGPQGELSVEESVGSMMEMFAKLTDEHNGGFVDWKGDPLPW